MSSLVSSESSFDEIYSQLLALNRIPLLPPGKATDASMTDKISSIYVHPSLEAALHLLNCDLPSAHFLVRHMQAKPEYEAMYLHGVLHRIEGDYDNARAWYGDVADSDVFKHSWDSKDKALKFIDEVEELNKKSQGSQSELEKESLREFKAIIDFCVKRFGKEKVQDASKHWVQPGGEHAQMGQDMVTGDKGHRNF